MASIKVKYRASSVKHQDGTIYYQIIHERIPRQLFTEYHIFPNEWDTKRSLVITDPKSHIQTQKDRSAAYHRMDRRYAGNS